MSSSRAVRFRVLSMRIPILLSLLLAIIALPPHAAAAPTSQPPRLATGFDLPDWVTPDLQSALASVGATVLVPPYIPGPFGGLPSVDAGPGYYSLYWMIPGAPPTYLRITGEVGGSIPAFSYYDRNVQLTQNADVQGYPAYRDLTPIYDLVYVDMGGVVYTVESRNLSSDDSLSLANSLVALDMPAEPTPTDNGGSTGGDTGGNTTAEPTPTEPAQDDTTSAEPTPTPTPASEPAATSPALDAPQSVSSGETISIGVSGVDSADLQASAGKFTDTGNGAYPNVGPGAYEWTAPQTEKGRTVTVSLNDSGSGGQLASVQIRVEPVPDDQIPVVFDSLACPAKIYMGQMGAISVKGSGQMQLAASDGAFPDLAPNTAFAKSVDGSNVIPGVIRREKTINIWWEAPPADTEYTAYIFLQSLDGTTQLECGIDVVPADPVAYPDMGANDGTGSVGGVGISAVDGGDGSSIVSNDFPAFGVGPDGRVLTIPAGTVDGDGEGTPAASAPTPTPGSSAGVPGISDTTGVGSAGNASATPASDDGSGV